jgi:hypothetical protein
VQKKQKKTDTLALHRETLRQLGISELKRALAAGGRLRVTVGYQADTTPIYSYVDDTNP